MVLVGLTGGIGSGKSTVARGLAERGCHVIDADQVAREVVEVGEPALGELAERFGASILAADGTLDRAALASVVFHDDQARADLDRITHPRIAARIARRVAEHAADDPDGVVVVDHPLLLETGQAARFDVVVAVLADTEVRLTRLVDERGMSREDAEARMRAQVDDEVRRAAADHLVHNDGPIEDLEARIDALHARLRDLGRQPDRSAPDERSTSLA